VKTNEREQLVGELRHDALALMEKVFAMDILTLVLWLHGFVGVQLFKSAKVQASTHRLDPTSPRLEWQCGWTSLIHQNR